jgi:type II secretory pathway pseudopilin PulG
VLRNARQFGACRGFALMAALLAVLAVSLAAAVAVSRARFEAQRDKELQLLWVGNQFRQALRSYQVAIPLGGKAQYPMKLEDLLEDHRFPNTVRHLRQVYRDPFTGQADWVLEREGDRIVGLHSSSTAAPVRHADLGAANAGFASAQTYADWRFLATDPVDTASAAPSLAASSGSNGANPVTGGPSGDSPATDTPPAPPPPDPVVDGRAQCYAKYGTPSITCRGPNFAMGSDGPSCRRDMASALDQCVAAAGNP